jgi:hypothetical protein
MDMNHGEMSDEKRKMKMEWRNHMAMRTLAAVIVIVFVFWCGFEFGEIRAWAGSMHEQGMMQGGWGGNTMYGMGGGMRMQTQTPTTGVDASGGATTGN